MGPLAERSLRGMLPSGLTSRFRQLCIGLLCGVALVCGAAEGDFAPVPALKARVTDLTATLSVAEQARIETFLRDYEQRKGAQIAVLVVDSTLPETAFDYSMRVVDAWKLGRKDVDDGVLLLVAKSDRKLEIRTGRGTQGALTDAMSKRIIAEVIAPRFRAGNFAAGIEEGVQKIAAVLEGEALPPPTKKKRATSSTSLENFVGLAFLAALIVGPLLRAILGRFVGATATGGVTGLAAWWLAGGLLFPVVAGVIVFFVVLLMGLANFSRRSGGVQGGWSSGGGGWSGGGSDTFSGGGGGFDGGGASGDW